MAYFCLFSGWRGVFVVDFLDDEFERLSAGRALSAFDEHAVRAVAGLCVLVEGARRDVARYGAVVETSTGTVVENPAVSVEIRASAEIRGWVKARPDLFGAAQSVKSRPGRERFTGLEVV